MENLIFKIIEYGYLPNPNTTWLQPFMDGNDLIVDFPLNYLNIHSLSRKQQNLILEGLSLLIVKLGNMVGLTMKLFMVFIRPRTVTVVLVLKWTDCT